MKPNEVSNYSDAPEKVTNILLSSQKRAAIYAIMELTEEECLAIERELNLRSGRNHGN